MLQYYFIGYFRIPNKGFSLFGSPGMGIVSARTVVREDRGMEVGFDLCPHDSPEQTLQKGWLQLGWFLVFVADDRS